MSGVGEIPNRTPLPPSTTPEGAGCSGEDALPLEPARPSDPARSVAERAAAWIQEHEALLEQERRWQCCETALFAKARQRKISFDDALASDLAEAYEMRSLDRAIRQMRAKLDVEVCEIRSTQSSGIACAVARLELGVKLQGPFDWRDHALELVEGALTELRSLLRDSPSVRAGRLPYQTPS